MNPWIHLDTTQVPGEVNPMRLMRRGDDFSILVGTIELMSSRLSGSEKALGRLAGERLRGRARPHVLVGGLGMGFTLCAALAELGEGAQVSVAELVPAVVAWARGPLAHLFEGCLDDPRVTIHEADVNRLIQAGPERYDAILLDVDNGPEGLTSCDNDRLYDSWGLGRARWALRPGGVLGVWSGHPDRKFKARLQHAGFNVDEVRVRANVTSGRRHVIWFATKASGTAERPSPGPGPGPRRRPR